MNFLTLGGAFHIYNSLIIASTLILIILSLPLPKFIKGLIKSVIHYKIGNADSKGSGFGIRLTYLFILAFVILGYCKFHLDSDETRTCKI